MDSMNVEQAARALGISKEAVRKRLKRGTLEGVKDDKGIWHVYIQGQDKKQDTGQYTGQGLSGQYIDSLKEEIEFLRSELQRKDTLLMTLTNRIPQLEAPSEKRSFLSNLFKRKE